MPAGNDPTPLAELEQSFGVTSSAEELIKANHARMSDEQRAGSLKAANEGLTTHVRENLDELEGHLGHEVAEATVRGTGAQALIHYAYIGPRDAYEKDYVPFADVFGSDLAKQRRANLEAKRTDPDEAAREAAAQTVREADAKAAERLREAQAEADRIVADAREEAETAVREAQEEAARQRESLAADAQKAADAAREQAEQDKAEADAPKPKPQPKAKPAAGGR